MNTEGEAAAVRDVFQELPLVWRRVLTRLFDLDCNELAGARENAKNISNASAVRRDVAAVWLTDSGRVLLPTVDTVETEPVEAGRLDKFLKDGFGV